MDRWIKKDIRDTSTGLIIDTLIDVGSEVAADIAKESITSILGEVFIDAASSFIPGISGAVSGYKRARFERNIKTFTDELALRIDEMRTNLESKTNEQKQKIDLLFNYVVDYVIDEPQQEKINLMVNGFVNITEHEEITEDFVLTYYDVLKELRMVDISVLRLMYSSRYVITVNNTESFQDIMERYGISYEQYQSVRRNLQRMGLLTTITDLKITEDLNEIISSIKEIHKFLGKLTNPKNKSSLPKLKEPKLKSKDNLQISKFGKDFTDFFLDIDNIEN